MLKCNLQLVVFVKTVEVKDKRGWTPYSPVCPTLQGHFHPSPQGRIRGGPPPWYYYEAGRGELSSQLMQNWQSDFLSSCRSQKNLLLLLLYKSSNLKQYKHLTISLSSVVWISEYEWMGWPVFPCSWHWDIDATREPQTLINDTGWLLPIYAYCVGCHSYVRLHDI